jgi:hydroxypyruvate isomerase
MISSVMLWTLPGTLEEKLETAASAGMTHVSLTSEHARWTLPERTRFVEVLRVLNLRVHVIGATPGWRHGQFSMLDPKTRGALLNEVRLNLRTAVELNADAALLMTGVEIEHVPRAAQCAELVESCKLCAEIAAEEGVTLALEPLNTVFDHPGYFLVDGRRALRIVQLVDNPHLTWALDLYHQEAQAGNALEVLREAKPGLSMIHVADFPGRHEPGTGLIDYQAIYAAASQIPIDVVFEYLPTQSPIESLRVALDGLARGVGS